MGTDAFSETRIAPVLALVLGGRNLELPGIDAARGGLAARCRDDAAACDERAGADEHLTP